MQPLTARDLVLVLALYAICCIAFSLQRPIKARSISAQLQRVEQLIATASRVPTTVDEKLVALRVDQRRSMDCRVKRSHVLAAIVAAISGSAATITGPGMIVAEVFAIPVAYALGWRWAVLRRKQLVTPRGGLDATADTSTLEVPPLPPVVNAAWFLGCYIVGVLAAVIAGQLSTVIGLAE